MVGKHRSRLVNDRH